MKQLKYGNTNTFFIDGLLFDTDMPGTLPAFYKCIKANGIALGDIKHVMCSHFHPDHMGLVSQLNSLGIKLVAFENQMPFIHFSDQIISRISPTSSPIDEKDVIVVSLSDSRDFLEKLGINGQVVPTLSHSPDGIALVLDDGTCLAGDLEPRQYAAGYEDNKALEDDWKAIMALSTKTVHFGHNPTVKIA